MPCTGRVKNVSPFSKEWWAELHAELDWKNYMKQDTFATFAAAGRFEQFRVLDLRSMVGVVVEHFHADWEISKLFLAAKRCMLKAELVRSMQHAVEVAKKRIMETCNTTAAATTVASPNERVSPHKNTTRENLHMSEDPVRSLSFPASSSPDDPPSLVSKDQESFILTSSYLQQETPCLITQQGTKSNTYTMAPPVLGSRDASLKPPLSTPPSFNTTNQDYTSHGRSSRMDALLDPVVHRHLSPLYTPLRVYTVAPIKTYHDTRKQFISVYIPPSTYCFQPPPGVESTACVLLALVYRDSLKPQCWPKSREILLSVDNHAIPEGEIPAPWNTKKLCGSYSPTVSRNDEERARMYLCVDITKWVRQPKFTIQIQNRVTTEGVSGFRHHPGSRLMVLGAEHQAFAPASTQLKQNLPVRRWNEPLDTLGRSVNETNGEDSCDVSFAGHVAVSLRCPFSYSPIRTAVRGEGCLHAQVIDLDSLLVHVHRCKMWCCPLCNKLLASEMRVHIDENIQCFIDNENSTILPTKILLNADGSVRISEKYTASVIDDEHCKHDGELQSGSNLCMSSLFPEETASANQVQWKTNIREHIATRTETQEKKRETCNSWSVRSAASGFQTSKDRPFVID